MDMLQVIAQAFGKETVTPLENGWYSHTFSVDMPECGCILETFELVCTEGGVAKVKAGALIRENCPHHRHLIDVMERT